MINDNAVPKVIISLLSAPTSKLGGQEIRWGRVAEYFLQHPSINVCVLANSSLVQCLREIDIYLDGPDVIIMQDHPFMLAHNLRAQWLLWSLTRRGSIIHVPAVGIRTIYTALLSKKIKANSVIFSYTTATFRLLLDNPKNIKGFKLVERIAKHVDLFEVINPAVDWQGIVPESKIRIAPCSFSDPNRFIPAYPKQGKVVFAGHLSTAKGVYLLISILQAWPRDDTTEFLICGDADGTESSVKAEKILDQLCSTRPNWKRARYSDVSAEISDAKVFLSLQEFSNYPSQSLLEAMLSGCCIVATNTGETDLLVRKPYGVLVEKDAPVSESVQAIQRFLGMSETQIQLRGNAARQFVLENHVLGRYADHIVKLWNELS